MKVEPRVCGTIGFDVRSWVLLEVIEYGWGHIGFNGGVIIWVFLSGIKYEWSHKF